MSERSVQHATIVLERRFRAAPARVFAAWADPAVRALWDVPGEGWEVSGLEQDFRVGGREASRFGPKGGAVYRSEGRFLDIVPGKRIVSAGSMHNGEVTGSATLCTVELLPEGAGTRLILTDQSAFLDGNESPADRETGWGQILARLQAHLGDDGR